MLMAGKALFQPERMKKNKRETAIAVVSNCLKRIKGKYMRRISEN
jgi:hypothetical protein